MAAEPDAPPPGEAPPAPGPRPLHPAVWGLILLAGFVGAQMAASLAVTFAWVAAGGNPQRLLREALRSPGPADGAVVPGLDAGWSVALLLASAAASAGVAIPLAVVAHRNLFGSSRRLQGRLSPRTFGWGLLGFGLILGVNVALDIGLWIAGGPEVRERFDSSLQARLTGALARPEFLAFAVPVAGILAPAAEEFMFRGFFFRALGDWLRRSRGPRRAFWGAALLSGLAWGAVHLDPVVLPVIVAFGVALAWVYERSGSIVAPLLAHALHNTTTLVLLALFIRP